MATTYTTNYNLGKQENHADKFDMDVLTDNADKIDAALTGLQSGIDGKQAALSTEQLAAVNSGVTSTDVAQIGLNKNNISTLNQYAGGKNKFDIDSAAIYVSDASYTKNSDGTINVTKSTNTVGQVNMHQAFLGDTGTYIISGCPSGGSSTTYEMLIAEGNTVLARDYGEGASVSLTKGTVYQFKVVVRESQTLSNKLFKPMISTEGGDYQPYALSNAELTALADLAVPTIPSTTTLATYAGTLAKGYHTAFIVNGQNPSDSPVSDNCFVDFFVYSANTAQMRVYPTYSTYAGEFYVRTKVSGSWGGWYKFQGTAVTP